MIRENREKGLWYSLLAVPGFGSDSIFKQDTIRKAVGSKLFDFVAQAEWIILTGIAIA